MNGKTISQLIGEELYFARVSQRKTLEQVGDAIGKTRKTIQLYETGKISISVNTLIDICTALRINYIDVLTKVKSIYEESNK